MHPFLYVEIRHLVVTVLPIPKTGSGPVWYRIDYANGRGQGNLA